MKSTIKRLEIQLESLSEKAVSLDDALTEAEGVIEWQRKVIQRAKKVAEGIPFDDDYEIVKLIKILKGELL